MVMKYYFPLLVDMLPLYALILIIVGGVIIVAAIIFLLIFLNKRKKSPKINDSIWLEALGGKDNVTSISAIGSRITLALQDKEAIDREKLKELGVSSVITMSNKVTLVVTSNALEIANKIQEALNN